MKTIIRQFLVPAAMTIATLSSAAGAAVSVKADHVTVVPDPAGGNTVYGTLDVYVHSDDPTQRLGGFQIQVTLPEFQRDVTFEPNGVTNTSNHPALLPSESFFSSIESVKLRTIKSTFNPVDLIDNGGLAQIRFAVGPGIEGDFPVHVVSLAEDADFGTALLNGAYVPIPFLAVDGMVTVRVPEPAVAPTIGAALALMRRRARLG